MNYTVASYVVYLALTIRITVWVGRTLNSNGRVFLIDAFRGNQILADAVNQLLTVGFYLINIGYVSLMLHSGEKPTSLESAIEFISSKVGLVLVVLGVMHFFNVYVINRYRTRAMEMGDFPPVAPDAFVTPRGA